MSALEQWKANLAEIERLSIGPKRLWKHRADWWAASDAYYLLWALSVRRWSPATRKLIYQARAAVATAEKAMHVELDEREAGK